MWVKEVSRDLPIVAIKSNVQMHPAVEIYQEIKFNAYPALEEKYLMRCSLPRPQYSLDRFSLFLVLFSQENKDHLPHICYQPQWEAA